MITCAYKFYLDRIFTFEAPSPCWLPFCRCYIYASFHIVIVSQYIAFVRSSLHGAGLHGTTRIWPCSHTHGRHLTIYSHLSQPSQLTFKGQFGLKTLNSL